MPRGTKQSYSTKQKRTASKKIEQRAKPKGRSTKIAGRVAGARVTKQTGGGKKRTSK